MRPPTSWLLGLTLAATVPAQAPAPAAAPAATDLGTFWQSDFAAARARAAAEHRPLLLLFRCER